MTRTSKVIMLVYLCHVSSTSSVTASSQYRSSACLRRECGSQTFPAIIVRLKPFPPRNSFSFPFLFLCLCKRNNQFLEE